MKKNSSSDMKYRGSQLGPIPEASSDEELEKGYETPDDGGGKMSAKVVTPNSADSLGSVDFGGLEIVDSPYDRGGASNAGFLEEGMAKKANRIRLFGNVPAFPGSDYKAEKRGRGEGDEGELFTSKRKIEECEYKQENGKEKRSLSPDNSAQDPVAKKAVVKYDEHEI